jgi:hypothetical protein
VQENRAARAHIRGQERADVFYRNRFAHERSSPEKTTTIGTSIELHHHRADDAGAVLGIVNALRFASTRPIWPGLRALTTPARGTDRQLRDGGRSDEAHNDVDDDIA